MARPEFPLWFSMHKTGPRIQLVAEKKFLVALELKNACRLPQQKEKGNSEFVHFVWVLSKEKHCVPVCPYLLLCDVEDAFQGQLFKIEAVALIKVSADCLRVVVHHHRLLAHLSQSSDAGHCAPVKLNTAPCRMKPLIILSTIRITNSA